MYGKDLTLTQSVLNETVFIRLKLFILKYSFVLLLWTKCCGAWLLASASARGVHARWLWSRTASGLLLKPPCAATVVGGLVLAVALTDMAWCYVHPLTRCSCGTSGAARAKPILLLRYI